MILLMAPTAILYWSIFVYAASDLTDEMHISASTALNFSTINILIVALMLPPIGWLADKVGARKLFFVSSLATLIGAIPFWWMMHNPDLGLIYVGQMCLRIIDATGWALSVSTVAGMVPQTVRSSGVSIAIAIAVFAGRRLSRRTWCLAPEMITAPSFIAIGQLPSRAAEHAIDRVPAAREAGAA